MCTPKMWRAPLPTLLSTDETLRQFGTALNSGTRFFSMVRRERAKRPWPRYCRGCLPRTEVWIPYAVEVDGQIITIYDPSIHMRMPELEPENHDERWVLCQRPAVLVGGELTAEMLDLQFNPISKFYVGPVQMKANNGVLIIDDFGRQRIGPERTVESLDCSAGPENRFPDAGGGKDDRNSV